MRFKKGLNVYISAASRGVAFEIARRMARAGANIAISSRSEARLEIARNKLQNDFPDVTILLVPGDLSKAEDQEKIFDALAEQGFHPDVFVCSAGQPDDASISSVSRSQWRHDQEMILGQAIFASQRFVPSMVEKGYGRIIFISTSFAKMPDHTYVTSSMSRAGLFALSRAITTQYASKGIASFVVCLGFVNSPLLRNMALGREADAPDPAFEYTTSQPWLDKYEQWAQTIPARKIGSPEELAEAVYFLTSPAADYLNGSVMNFGGGLDKTLF